MASGPALVVLAAGMASRYGSPKQLDSIGPHGEGIIDYSVFDAARAGFGKVVFVINEQSADSFDAAFMRLRQQVEIEYAFQDRLPPPREKPWGTGHALLSAADHVKEPFAMINADDYYGVSAFASAVKFLQERNAASFEYGMLGYDLRDTLSPHGSVSRGLCNVGHNSELRSITEHSKIVFEKGRPRSLGGEDDGRALTGDEPTSMNFWMLTPTIFRHLRDGLRTFLASNRDSATAEFVLPEFIGELIKRQIVTISVLPHSDMWIGLTYQEDKARASQAIEHLHADGTYPSPLWPQA